MVLAQVELLFSLGDSAQEYGIPVALKASLGLLQELDRHVDVGVLPRG